MSDLGNKPMICSASGVECNVGRQFEGIDCDGPIKVFIADGDIFEDADIDEGEGVIRNARVRVSDKVADYCGKRICHAVSVNDAMGWTAETDIKLDDSSPEAERIIDTAIKMFISDTQIEDGDVIFAITGLPDGERKFVAVKYKEVE